MDDTFSFLSINVVENAQNIKFILVYNDVLTVFHGIDIINTMSKTFRLCNYLFSNQGRVRI